MSDPQVSNLSLGRHATMEKMLLYMLNIRSLTSQYHACFPDLDITKNPQWWVMNPGYRMEGKLPTFAEKENLPLRALRSGVTIGRKELLIEFELSEPGIALVLMPVVKKLQHLPYPELKLACDLLRRGMYPNILRVSRLFSDDVPKYQLEFNIVLVWPDQPYGQFFAF